MTMAVPDPNKQTFPIIHNPTQFLVPSNCPSPTKTVESNTSTIKPSPVQFPAILPSGGGDNNNNETAQQNTMVSFPKVKNHFLTKKTTAPEMRGSKIPEHFKEVPVNPMPYQFQSFRSTTKVKEVPMSKRHHDMFSTMTRSNQDPLVKTKNISFYTKPFLWEAKLNTNTQAEARSLPSRFFEEEEALQEMRGQKRKYGVPTHRRGYQDLFVGGNTPFTAQKFDYKSEADKLRHMVLPENAQELYTGRGIKLPENHTTNRRKKEWTEKIYAEYALPESVPMMVEPPTKTTTAAGTTTAGTTTDGVEPETQSAVKSSRKPLRRKSNASMGTRRNSDVNRSRRGSNAGRGQKEQPEQKGRIADSQPVDHLQDHAPYADADIHVTLDTEDASTAVQAQTISEENGDEIAKVAEENRLVHRLESEMETDIQEPDSSRHHCSSSLKGTSPNPLSSIDLSLHVEANQKEELYERFSKLDTNKDGHITFQELTSVLPKTLTKSQKKFMKQVYEAVSSSTFFGLEEFVGVTCLAEMMTNLSDQVKDAYDALDFATVKQSITQLVMMFSSVDRQQTGAISVASLLELLSMTTDGDLALDEDKASKILNSIQKDHSSAIDKVEFLAYLPYFLQFR